MATMTETWQQWILRALHAQEAVDQLLSPERQIAELMPDDTYRVRCSRCGKSVSNPSATPLIVRAWVQCPECYESAAKLSAD